MTAPRYQNQSAERSFAILECVGAAENPIPLAVIVRETGLNRATVFRMLAVLTRMGWIYKSETDSTYALGYKAFGLGRRKNQLETVAHHARPFMRRLAADLGESVHLAAREGTQIVCFDKAEPSDGPPLVIAVGMRLDAHATASGKAVLAWLAPDEVRQLYSRHPPEARTARTITGVDTLLLELSAIRMQGYAVDEGEAIPEFNCVAAPIMHVSGEAVAALSVSGPASRLDPARVSLLAGRLTATAAEISDYIVDHDSRSDSR
ncbi:MAG: IclR family transcriptional regulator [Proteobacteria bacterium]|nr:IclR family transcriptional regulator [Pseudomonadota bacterium]